MTESEAQRRHHGRAPRELSIWALVSVAVLAAAAWSGVSPLVLIPATAALFVAGLAWSFRYGSADPDPGLLTRRFGGSTSIVDRRSALRMLGLSALFVGPATALPKILDKVFATKPQILAQEEFESRFFRIRQWTMIIDLRSCDGCQSVESPPRCTKACIEGHLAPEPMEWIEVFEDELEGTGTRFLPTPCQHCQNPPCVNVCPVAATFSSPEGLVLIDQDRCIGCRICMAACPYDRRFFNWGQPPIPAVAAEFTDYDIETQVPARKGTVMKCDFCPDMVRAGALPYCIQACPHAAIYYGDLEEDVATNGRQVVAISEYLAENDAFRLKEELGTQPRVFYIPGHGEAVGRRAESGGRLPMRWPWADKSEGSAEWSR